MDVKQRIIEARERNTKKKVLDKEAFNNLIVEAIGENEQGRVKVYETNGNEYSKTVTCGVGAEFDILIPTKVFHLGFEYIKEMGWTYNKEPYREGYNYGYRGYFYIDAGLVLKD